MQPGSANDGWMVKDSFLMRCFMLALTALKALTTSKLFLLAWLVLFDKLCLQSTFVQNVWQARCNLEWDSEVSEHWTSASEDNALPWLSVIVEPDFSAQPMSATAAKIIGIRYFSKFFTMNNNHFIPIAKIMIICKRKCYNSMNIMIRFGLLPFCILI